MKLILIGAALAAVSALPASAYEIRDYSMQADETSARPGLEYVVVDRHGKKVTVVEGQPRWTTQDRTIVQGRGGDDDAFRSLSRTLQDLLR
jgi:hypothetical protein